MSAEDAFGFHAEGEFASRHALPFNGCADVLLEIVIGVDGGHMLASIAREGTGRRETLTKRGISLLWGSFAHFMRTGMRVVNQSAVGSFLTYSSRKRPWIRWRTWTLVRKGLT